MLVQVISKFNRRGELQLPGGIIEIDATSLLKLEGFVKPLSDGKELPHFCIEGDCWCSARLPSGHCPAECIPCEYYLGTKGSE